MIRPPRTRSRSWPVALAAMLCVPVMNGPRYAQQPARIGERTATQDQDLGGLRYRLVGPFRGGRATTVAGVSGDPRTYYFGTAGGGVWKTTNGGQTWTPIFDGQPVGAIGDLAVAPSNPNVLYVGTGDADLRNNVSHGNGVYKSVDAGRTWHHLGLADTRHIGRVVVHPSNPEVVFVAALGHAFGPNDERGVFRTRDGGGSWERVLAVDANTGAVDVSLAPTNPKLMFAAMWLPWARIDRVAFQSVLNAEIVAFLRASFVAEALRGTVTDSQEHGSDRDFER